MPKVNNAVLARVDDRRTDLTKRVHLTAHHQTFAFIPSYRHVYSNDAVPVAQTGQLQHTAKRTHPCTRPPSRTFGATGSSFQIGDARPDRPATGGETRWVT